MDKKIRFYAAVLLYFMIIVFDGLCTYIGTPDLALEGNPLVADLGLGWGTLLAVNAFFYVIYCVAAWFWLVRYEPPRLKAETTTLRLAELFFGEGAKASWLIWKLPTNKKPFLACFCCGFVIGLPLGRCVTVYGWFLHLLNLPQDIYIAVRNAMPFGRLDVIVTALTALTSMLVWCLIQGARKPRISNVTK